jgi:DNA primase
MKDDPSSDLHGIFRCWACAYRGDAVTLTKDLLGVGYHAACAWIDEFARLDPELPATARVEIVEPKVFRLPAGVEEDVLARWPTPFRRYLERRRIPAWQVARWRIGFAIEGRLTGRVVVPARAESGRLLSYAARAIDDGVRLRYLTPSRGDGAELGALFGEEQWRRQTVVVVTEGAFDALAVERAQPEFAIAGLDGASRADGDVVLAKLDRFPEVIVATDPDLAGDAAAAVLYARLGSKVSRARPPPGFDCAKMDLAELRGILGA